MKKAGLTVCVLSTVLLLGAPAFAQGETQTGEAEAQQADSSRVYELQDSNEDSPPLNFRSHEDDRYNTASQHDAEMYAEQYERERQLKEQQDMQRLKDLDGFAAGSPYKPGLGNSSYR